MSENNEKKPRDVINIALSVILWTQVILAGVYLVTDHPAMSIWASINYVGAWFALEQRKAAQEESESASE